MRGLFMKRTSAHLILATAVGMGAAQAETVTTLPSVVVQDTSVRPGSIQLDEASATGSRLGLSLREIPSSVYAVDSSTMEARGSRNTQEALRNVPGMSFVSKPDLGGFLSYRGFSGPQLTQLYNGISVQYDVVAARPVGSWTYDRVEVIGGPSSFLYGAGAVGGSVNYITKTAERNNSATAQVRAGSYGSGQMAMSLNRQLAGHSGQGHFFRVDANVERNASHREGNRQHATQISASLLSDLNSQLSHTLALEYQKEKLKRPYWGTPVLAPTVGTGRILPGTKRKNYNSADSKYEQDVKWARSILDYRASEKLQFKNTLYHYSAWRNWENVEAYRFNRSNTAVIRHESLLQQHKQKLTGNRLEATLNTQLAGRKSDWVFGADYSVNRQVRFPSFSNENVSTVDPFNYRVEHIADIPGLNPLRGSDREVKSNTFALFAENRTQVAPSLSLLTGLRHDRIRLNLTNHRAVTASSPASFSQRYNATTGRVGLVWDISPEANLYGQFATSADPPSGSLMTSSFAQARNNTKLTTGRQWEIGSKMRLWDGRATATVSAYHIVRKNLSTPDPAAPRTNVLLVGQQSAQGLEAALDVRLTKQLSAQANIAFVDAKYDNFSENVGGVAVSRAGKAPPNTPKKVANLWLNYAITPGLEAWTGVRAVSSSYGNNANTFKSPGYGLIDLGLNWQYSKNISLKARIRNVGNKVYASHITHTPMFYLGEPRTFDVTAKLSF